MAAEFLSPHFTREEMTRSEIGARAGIPNVPGADELANLEALCLQVLEPARAALGRLWVNSGYRSVEINKLARGARNSQHLHGEAADVTPLDCSMLALYRWLREYAPFDQLIWEFDTWLHVSHVRGGTQRGATLRAVKQPQAGKLKTVYLALTRDDDAHLALTLGA